MKTRKFYYRKTDILSYFRHIYLTEKNNENQLIELDNDLEEFTLKLKIKDINKFKNYLIRTKRNYKNKLLIKNKKLPL